MDALTYAKMGAETVMCEMSPEELPPTKCFHYHQGVFLEGVKRVYKLTQDDKYRDYINAWVNLHVDEKGGIPMCHTDRFDDLQPAVLLFDLYDETSDRRYKKALDMCMNTIEIWPTNAKGGVWHKFSTKNEMWLDTMYMMGFFTAMYAKYFHKPYFFEKLYSQLMLMYDNMRNPETGLLYHMWDDSKKNPFADPKDGLVKVHWGRAMGWYMTAMAEFLSQSPADSRLRHKSEELLREFFKVLKNYQDDKTGLWYQVLDKGDDSRNWLETSCSALFTYSAAKSFRKGVIGEEYREMIMKGYNGVLSKTDIDDGKLRLGGICIGTGVGVTEHYFSRPTSVNDLHGMGAFLLMCSEIHRTFEKR